MNNARLFALWLIRVLANALAGGLAFAVVGAFCGGGAVLFPALIICLLEHIGMGEGSILGVIIGASLGTICGIAVIFIHLFFALGAEPGEFWQPFVGLTARISWGQIGGTIAASAAFVAFELVRSQFNRVEFSNNIGKDCIPILSTFFVPISMILGAIAAAILGRD